jgi:uncharacterized protein
MAIGETEIPAPQEITPTGRVTPVAPVWHTIVLLVAVVGLAALSAWQQLASRGGPFPSRTAEYSFTLAYEFLLLGYVWFFGLRRYHVTLAELIGGKWKRWADFWRDVGIALLFWLVVAAVIVVLSLSLHFSGVEAAKSMYPKTPLEVCLFLVLACSAGFCEEIVFRGYLQRQFAAWTGSIEVGIALQAIVFGSGHMYQGVKGVVVTAIYGALFGILAKMRKSLRPGIMQHCGQDTISGIVVYFATKYKYLQIIKF